MRICHVTDEQSSSSTEASRFSLRPRLEMGAFRVERFLGISFGFGLGFDVGGMRVKPPDAAF
jgi:hypothetical protein